MDLWTELPFLGKFAVVGLLICACIIGWLLECRLRCAEGRCQPHIVTHGYWSLVERYPDGFVYVTYVDPIEGERFRFIEREKNGL